MREGCFGREQFETRSYFTLVHARLGVANAGRSSHTAEDAGIREKNAGFERPAKNDVESRFQYVTLKGSSMIVCLCKGVSGKRVQRAIDDGASDLESVGRACGAGTDCGACHGEIDAMLRAADVDRTGPRRLVVLPTTFDSEPPNRAA